MSSRSLAGKLLIFGPLLTLAAVLAGPIGPSVDQGNAVAVLTALGKNVAWSQATLMLMGLGLALRTVGLAGIKDSMTGGSGYHYAQLGFLLILLGTAGELIEVALMAGAAEAAGLGAAGMATGGSLWASSGAVGASSTILIFLGIAILGAAILIQKNFHVVIALGLILAGITGIVMPIIDYHSSLMAIPYVGGSVVVVVMGVLTVRNKS
jgi:hypothetical protein